MSKTKLKYFVSYARKTEKRAHDFLDIFEDHAGLSKNYIFEKWIDRGIILGEGWDRDIQEAIKTCDFGILLLSATFFNRSYIKNHELPHFIDSVTQEIKKPIIPVGLESFNLGGDLLGLENFQIYRYQKSLGENHKFFNQLRKNQRIEFVQGLLSEMHRKFDKSFLSETIV